MQLLSRRIRMAGLVTVLAAAGVMMPALPASADKCGVTIPCIPYVDPGPIDVFGEAKGQACGGVFEYSGDEGSRMYYFGYIEGGSYIHTDVQTRRMTVTCDIRDADSQSAGSSRGSVTAQSIAPLNNVVSATGLRLDFWFNYPATETLWLCTTVRWVDRIGLNHTQNGPCLELVPLIPDVAS
jgi:hypothetical protein